ncbi:Crp/Fnr family transcriptional regulator [Sphingoaurantiacus capsulatus]|uniref:Crp/Fnr family transcriptional regulator n=1 Tax=Sphingoaurantiacus capsulatus TaxID=1771310 RepID=A0ABV7X7U4_9SPHN
MGKVTKGTVRNRLLKELSDEDFDRLAPLLTPVELPKHAVLIEQDGPVLHGWFIEDGLGSVIAHAPDGDTAELGLYGFEGFACVPSILGGGHSQHSLVMQVGGNGLRLRADALQQAMRESEKLHGLMLCYVHYFLTQVGQTAVSNAMHTVEERLARWLLMSHDRLDDDRIPLTHEYLSVMLAVRRPSVTTALHVLEGLGYIRGHRGVVQMRDREGLESFAASAYGIPEAAYEKMIGPLR